MRSVTDRSLERRWALKDAEPVLSFLPPYTEFVPADLRIWWNADTGKPTANHRLNIYAWPAERDSHVSAHWTGGHNQKPMPPWIRELSDVVHEDLIANATSTNAGIEDRWTYSMSCRWTLENASPIPSTRHAKKSFAPACLSIWHSYSAGDTKNDRHRINASPAGRDLSARVFADWGGGVGWQGSPRYNEEIPGWIRNMAEEQHRDLVAFATQFEHDREG